MREWLVDYSEDFLEEVQGYPVKVQEKIAALAIVLEACGPDLGRPKVDTLKGSKHPNMLIAEARFVACLQQDRFTFRIERESNSPLTLVNSKPKQGTDRHR